MTQPQIDLATAQGGAQQLALIIGEVYVTLKQQGIPEAVAGQLTSKVLDFLLAQISVQSSPAGLIAALMQTRRPPNV